MTIHRSAWADLTPGLAHDLIALRVAVFVVEQQCAYHELDGRDVEPATAHLWTADLAGPTAYLRVLAEADGGIRIGRVCTRIDVRGRGLAADLLTEALRNAPGRTAALEAQTHLADWYQRFGFVVTGPEYLEDGIAHLPMRRA